MRKKILTVVGARPQIIKAAAVSRAISGQFNSELHEVIVHTGQHYDEAMSQVFFNELGIPQPDYNLHVGSGSHGAQTALMLDGLEKLILSERPDAVLVYGDTNSTLAASLAASKMHLPVVHVEAGLRSFNKSMPEEINRIVCDHSSTLLFTPTQSGLQNLLNEGFKQFESERYSIDHPGIFLCGDVMFDNSMHYSNLAAKQSQILNRLQLDNKSPFILATIHRDNNTDDPQRLKSIFNSLFAVAEKTGMQIILPLHPRTKKMMAQVLEADLQQRIEKNDRIRLIEPASFLDMIQLESNSTLIITDSGGVQKEAYFFQKPCVILRPQTEWIELVNNGNAILADADSDRIQQAADVLLSKNDFTWPAFYGDAHAAEFICATINRYIG